MSAVLHTFVLHFTNHLERQIRPRKLRVREINELPPNHTANGLHIYDWNLGSQLVWAVVTQDQLSGLNNKSAFLTVLEGGGSKIKTMADSIPDEDPLPGLQTVSFSLVVPGQEREWEKERALGITSYQDTNPIHEGSMS